MLLGCRCIGGLEKFVLWICYQALGMCTHRSCMLAYSGWFLGHWGVFVVSLGLLYMEHSRLEPTTFIEGSGHIFIIRSENSRTFPWQKGENSRGTCVMIDGEKQRATKPWRGML